MIRLRVRCFYNGIMYDETPAALFAACQSAYDYGLRAVSDVIPHDYRAEGAHFMLWTGAMDLEATEVYEGDIVEVYAPGGTIWLSTGVVTWMPRDLGYCVMRNDGRDRMPLSIQVDGTVAPLRVLGNVHEHPDLLQQIGLIA